MTDDTTALENLGVEIPLESYDIGYGTPAKSYATLLKEAWEAADTRFGNLDVLPYRLLSSFGSLQAAVEWSAQFPGTVYVDGKFRTDETNVLIDDQVTFIGDRPSNLQAPFRYPAIISTNTSDTEPLFRYAGNNCVVNFDTVNFYNEGDPRAFFVPTDTYSGFLSNNSSWTNVMVARFGATAAHPYTVFLNNAYAMTIQNSNVRNRGTTGYGAWRLRNCNACVFAGLQAVDTVAADDETPGVYVETCNGLHLDSPHLEEIGTDAVLQISGGDVTVTNLFLEAHHSAGANCAIQIGDGGKAQGNTSGGTKGGRLTIIEPNAHALERTPAETIRVLNGDSTKIIGGSRQDTSTMNYGGSNNDSGLVASPGPVKIIGDVDIDVTNSTNEPASVSIQNGRVFGSESAATSGMQPYETAKIDTGTSWAWAWLSESGLRTWWASESARELQLTTSDTTTDINQPSPTPIPWDSELTTSDALSHSPSTNPETITFDKAGRYHVEATISAHAGNTARLSAAVFLTLNGAELDGARSYCYMRGTSGVLDASTTLHRIVDVSAGDTLEVHGERAGANTAPITLNANESVLVIQAD